MSTPTPSPASVPSEPVQPALSEPQRLINTFIAPSKTFLDIRRNATWWVPWLLGAIISVVFAVVAVQKLDIEQLVRQGIEHSSAAQRRMEQLTPEQRDKAMAAQAKITTFFFYASPVFFLIVGIIIAAALLATFNFGFAAELTFKQALAIVFYGTLPGIVPVLILIISLLASSDPNSIDFTSGNPIATSPAFFMDAAGNKFLYAIASSVDIVRIWQIILIGLGVSLVTTRRKLSAATAITTIFVIYGVLVLIRGGIALAFS